MRVCVVLLLLALFVFSFRGVGATLEEGECCTEDEYEEYAAYITSATRCPAGYLDCIVRHLNQHAIPSSDCPMFKNVCAYIENCNCSIVPTLLSNPRRSKHLTKEELDAARRCKFVHGWPLSAIEKKFCRKHCGNKTTLLQKCGGLGIILLPFFMCFVALAYTFRH